MWIQEICCHLAVLTSVRVRAIKICQHRELALVKELRSSTVHSGGARLKQRSEPGSYPWPRPTSPMDTVRTEVLEYTRQHEIPSQTRRPRNEDTSKKSLQRKRTAALPRSVTGADIGEPGRWIPENPYDIPSFLTWLANFQTELDNVKEEARRRLVHKGGSTSLRRAYEEELARRRQADAEITRKSREVAMQPDTEGPG